MGEMTRPRHRKQWRFTASVVGDGPWTHEASTQARQMIYAAQQENTENFKAAALRKDFAATERIQAMIEAYNEALHEVGERDLATMRRLGWESQDKQHRHLQRWARYRHRSDILRDARTGDLPPNWRTERTAIPDDVAPGLREVYATVVNELADLPPQPWEPYAAGGDWRAALDAWHHDSLAVLDTYHQGQMSDAQTPHPRFAPADSAELNEREAQRQVVATDLATNLERAARAVIEHSYRAGLAAGENPDADDAEHPLPRYWLHQAPAD